MEYTKAPQKRNEPVKRETTQPSPYIVTKASKKSITFTICIFELVVAQDHSVKIKEFFIHWVEGTKSLKTTIFLSFQIVHNKCKGAAIQTFQGFSRWWTFPPCQSILYESWEDPVNPKNHENKSPMIVNLRAVQQQMVQLLLILTTQRASTSYISSPFLKLLHS